MESRTLSQHESKCVVKALLWRNRRWVSAGSSYGARVCSHRGCLCTQEELLLGLLQPCGTHEGEPHWLSETGDLGTRLSVSSCKRRSQMCMQAPSRGSRPLQGKAVKAGWEVAIGFPGPVKGPNQPLDVC